MPKVTQPKIPTHSSKDPYILRVLELSTAHITHADSDLLSKSGDLPFTCYDLEYGSLLYCGEPEEAGREHDIAQAGFSAAFLLMVRMAWKHGCAWIRLDCDSFVYTDLPTFKW